MTYTDPPTSASVDGEDITPASVSTGDLNDIQWLDSPSEIKTALEGGSDGDVFRIEPGTYDIDNPITVNTHSDIGGGGGYWQTRLNKLNDAPMFEFREKDFWIHDLFVYGLGKNTGTTAGIVTPQSSSGRVGRIYMDSILVQQCGGNGFKLGSCNVSELRNLRAGANGENGLVTGGPDANEYTLVNYFSKSNAKAGFKDLHPAGGSSYGLTVIGGYSTTNGTVGWDFNSPEINCYGFGGEGDTNDTYHIQSTVNESLFIPTHHETWTDDSDSTVTNLTRGGKIAAPKLNHRDPLVNDTIAIGSGATSGYSFAASVGTRVNWSVVPESDPGNDVGFEVSALYWDDSAGNYRAEVTETQNSGGGTARLTIWEVGV